MVSACLWHQQSLPSFLSQQSLLFRGSVYIQKHAKTRDFKKIKFYKNTGLKIWQGQTDYSKQASACFVSAGFALVAASIKCACSRI